MTFSVRQLLQQPVPLDHESGLWCVEVEGWLTMAGGDLVLLEEVRSAASVNDERIEIANPEIIYAIRNQILPLGGGYSFLCHQARISGKIASVSPLSVMVETLAVSERREGFRDIEINEPAISRGQKKYGHERLLSKKSGSGDWLDHVLDD